MEGNSESVALSVSVMFRHQDVAFSFTFKLGNITENDLLEVLQKRNNKLL